jgi:hypothetical protein
LSKGIRFRYSPQVLKGAKDGTTQNEPAGS